MDLPSFTKMEALYRTKELVLCQGNGVNICNGVKFEINFWALAILLVGNYKYILAANADDMTINNYII